MWNGYEGGGRNKTNCLARAHFQNPYALENSKDNKPAFSWYDSFVTFLSVSLAARARGSGFTTATWRPGRTKQCACVCVYEREREREREIVMQVCVCVWEREREREREKEREWCKWERERESTNFFFFKTKTWTNVVIAAVVVVVIFLDGTKALAGILTKMNVENVPLLQTAFRIWWVATACPILFMVLLLLT